ATSASTSGSAARPRASACSRPPYPINSTRTAPIFPTPIAPIMNLGPLSAACRVHQLMIDARWRGEADGRSSLRPAYHVGDIGRMHRVRPGEAQRGVARVDQIVLGVAVPEPRDRVLVRRHPVALGDDPPLQPGQVAHGEKVAVAVAYGMLALGGRHPAVDAAKPDAGLQGRLGLAVGLGEPGTSL